MKGAALVGRILYGLLAIAVVGLVVLVAFAVPVPAHGQPTGPDILPGGPPGPATAPSQVTDAPIQRIGALDRMVVNSELLAGRHCASWWERDADRFGDYHRVNAAVDVPLLAASAVASLQAAIAARDVAGLVQARTHNVGDLQAALRPCVPDWEPKADPVLEAVRQRELDRHAKLRPAPAWVVATSTAADGTRPAYCLQADGTRIAKACERVPATITGNGATVASWCDCTVRSKEPAGSTSTYCRPATEPRTFDAGEPVRVTLCRESK